MSMKYTTAAAALGAQADADIDALTAQINGANVGNIGGGEPVAPGSALIYADDFTSYKTTAALLTYNPAGNGYIHMDGEAGVTLDLTGGILGTPACRITWTPKGGCADDSHLISRGFAAVPTLCMTWAAKYSAGFIWDWLGRTPCLGNAKKLLFLTAPVQTSRFDLICENHAIGCGSDFDHPLHQQMAPIITPEMLGDGAWHRFTLRVRQSSTPTATDGHIEGWVDGVKKWDVPSWASACSGGWNGFMMPTTFNEGSPIAQAEWLDHLALWAP